MTSKVTNNKVSLSLTSSLCPAVPYSHNRSIVSLSRWQEPIPYWLQIFILSIQSISPLVTPLHSFLVPFRAGGGWSGEGHVENRARQTLNGTGRDVEWHVTSRGGCSEWCPIRPTKGTKRDRADTTHIIRPSHPHPAPHLIPYLTTLTSSSSSRFLSSYLRSSGCRSSTSLSIHLLRRNEGTEVSEWRTEEGKNGVRNGLSSLIHFAVLSPLLCHSARYTHLVPRSGLSGMRRSDEDRGEKSRVPAVRRFGSPHVISARFLRMSFTPFTRRSRSGGRKWTGVNGMLTSGENRGNRLDDKQRQETDILP